jgi:OFA family oxalate/formate antiporter-like MFS transporter
MVKLQPALILLASVTIPLCLGGVYAWSMLVEPLHQVHGLSYAQAQSIFGVTIAAFTLVMVAAGRLLSRFGPRVIASVGGVLFTTGYLLAAASGATYVGLLIGVGLLAGAGIGCAYITPLTTAMAWFPQRRGLITGLAVAGMGGGASVLSAGISWAFAQGQGVPTILAGIGLVYGAVIVLCGQWLRFPPHDAAACTTASNTSFWRHRPFWGMVVGMGCGTFAGLLVVGNLKPLGMSWGMAETVATLAVTLFAVGNALGRLGWGALADAVGTWRAITASLLLGAVSLGALAFLPPSTPVFLCTTSAAAIAFGGCFVLYAAHVAEQYGPAHLPVIYPWIFLAYGAAALLGPTTGGMLYDTIGSYQAAVGLAALVCAIGGLCVPMLLKASDAPVTAPTTQQEMAS